MLNKIFNGLARVPKHVLDFVLPPMCLHCDSPLEDNEKYLCGKCTDSLTLIDNESNPDLQRINENANVAKAYSLFLFSEGTAIQSLIHNLKYGQMRRIGKEYGKKLAVDVLKPEKISIDFIIPVPLHISKKRERGYNQSDFICEGISYVLNVPVLLKGLKRKKFTQTQTKLSREERQMNVRDAFVVRKKYTGLIKGKNILLVDDVITTGSTTLECARVLKDSGCGDVYVCSIALAE